MLSVLRTSKVVTAQHCWGLLGAGVPPLLGALALLAYWGAPDAVVGSLTCPYSPLPLLTTHYSLLTTHYSLLSTLYPLGFGFSMRSF